MVYDAKTGEDITRSVLTQIIFEEENKGTNLLPINFLRQLIRFYGDSMQTWFRAIWNSRWKTSTKEHDKIREQMMDAVGRRALQEHGRTRQAQHGDVQRCHEAVQPLCRHGRQTRGAATIVGGAILAPQG